MFFKTKTKCDANDNNLREIFNSHIALARTKSIVDMLDDIRSSFFARFEAIRCLFCIWLRKLV